MTNIANCLSYAWVKFVYSKKATQFAKSSPYFCLQYIQTKVKWRFRKTFWEYMNFNHMWYNLYFCKYFKTVFPKFKDNWYLNVLSKFFPDKWLGGILWTRKKPIDFHYLSEERWSSMIIWWFSIVITTINWDGLIYDFKLYWANQIKCLLED